MSRFFAKYSYIWRLQLRTYANNAAYCGRLQTVYIPAGIQYLNRALV